MFRRFYRELLTLDVALETDNAVLLAAADGSHLVLRRLERSVRGSGILGVQSLIWSVPNPEDLNRAEHVLISWNARTASWKEHGVTTLEGHDPDRLPILMTYPHGLGELANGFPARVFAY